MKQCSAPLHLLCIPISIIDADEKLCKYDYIEFAYDISSKSPFWLGYARIVDVHSLSCWLPTANTAAYIWIRNAVKTLGDAHAVRCNAAAAVKKVKSNCFESLGNEEADARIGNLNKSQMKLERNFLSNKGQHLKLFPDTHSLASWWCWNQEQLNYDRKILINQ